MPALLLVAQVTIPIIVALTEAPGASEEKLTVLLLPDMPQTPPPVALHPEKMTLGGRMSVTVKEVAGTLPWLVTVRVKVILEPAATKLGEATLLMTKSVEVPTEQASPMPSP